MYEVQAYGVVDSQNPLWTTDPRMWACTKEQLAELLRGLVEATKGKGGFVTYESNQARKAGENETIITITEYQSLVPTFAGGTLDIPEII